MHLGTRTRAQISCGFFAQPGLCARLHTHDSTDDDVHRRRQEGKENLAAFWDE